MESFYKYFIGEIIGVSQKNVRSNYNVNLDAKYDEEKNKVYTEGTYCYRLYPSENGYTDIAVGFSAQDGTCSTVHITTTPSEGKRKIFLNEDLEFVNINDMSVTEVNVNDLYGKSRYIDVDLVIKEYGNCHWQHVFFRAEQATDRFRFDLKCADGITIKSHALYGVLTENNIDTELEEESISVSCHKWINEGTGISIVISKPETAT